MNMLAHLHLASFVKSDFLGNLAADFIRGSPEEHYSLTICEGIHFHRHIDHYVDSLVTLKQLRKRVFGQYYRLSAITVDILWDHFLALHWSNIEKNSSLCAFCEKVKNDITDKVYQLPEAFQRFNTIIWEKRLLEKYAERDFILEVLQRIESRRPRLTGLSATYPMILVHYKELEMFFYSFYQQLTDYVIQKKVT